ncbi:MAG: YkgJ family cysteine cluster protein [Candidatus Heimdallarchaeota archaeon]|nr:YkgJ family cysteine cluster protein [Candidatus Heimdallarchaeota archaeon]
MQSETLGLSYEDRLLGYIDLEKKQVEVNPVVSMGFICTMNADCCRRFQVQLTDLDVHRIETRGFDLFQFVQDGPAMLKLPRDPSLPVLQYWHMKKRPFDGQCVFIEDGRCSIHAFKPHSCRLYPFVLDVVSGGRYAVYYHPSMKCSGLDSVLSNQQQVLEDLLKIQMVEMGDRLAYYAVHTE